MTYVIGITGGIGSGKSTLARCFSEKGIPVFDADEISRFALTPASGVFGDVVSLFGNEAVKEDGTLDRAYIASRVFAEPCLRESLNAIVHPFVLEELIRRTEASESPLAVWDVPLLFESGVDAYCACTVAVLCSEDIRIARTVLRDGSTEAQVRARIRTQLPDAEKERLATYSIRNEGTEEAFSEEASELIDRIRRGLT